MFTRDKRPPEERFADFLKHSEMFLRKTDIDVAGYLAKAKTEGVAIALRAFFAESEKKKVILPPGYWHSLHQLQDEVDPDHPTIPEEPNSDGSVSPERETGPRLNKPGE